MRPKRLELCITWESTARKPSTGSREPCYATGKEGRSMRGWFAWLWGPQNGKKRKKLCWTAHGNKRCWRFPDASNCRIFPKTIKSNTCIRGFLWWVALQQIPSHRSWCLSNLETVRTAIRAHTIFSFPMAGLCYSKTFIDEAMPSPSTGRARSCPPIMTFWHWIRPSMASIFPFVESFCGMLRLGLVWCMKIIEKKLRTQAEKPDALNLYCLSEEMQLKLQASCCRHRRPSQQTVSIYGRPAQFYLGPCLVHRCTRANGWFFQHAKPEIWNNSNICIHNQEPLILRFDPYVGDRPTPAPPSLSGVEVAAEVWVAVQWNTSESARYLSGESRETHEISDVTCFFKDVHGTLEQKSIATQWLQDFASKGSYGHPKICRRPCILFVRGRCEMAENCGFCHVAHEARFHFKHLGDESMGGSTGRLLQNHIVAVAVVPFAFMISRSSPRLYARICVHFLLSNRFSW